MSNVFIWNAYVDIGISFSSCLASMSRSSGHYWEAWWRRIHKIYTIRGTGACGVYDMSCSLWVWMSYVFYVVYPQDQWTT